MPHFGNAAIVWTSTSDGDHVFNLQAPLRRVRSSVRQLRWVRESLDLTGRTVATVGDGVYEIMGAIKYADDAQTLADMLLAGWQGKTLTYIPDLTDQATSFDCDLIEPSELPTTIMDSDRGFPGFEDQEIEIRLRQTDGSPFG